MLTYDLSEKGNLAIYEYLYQCIKEDIINGRLAGGAKLPSKRKMAQQHQVSLKTVENAYEQLLLEGYITAKEKQGYFVMENRATACRNAKHSENQNKKLCRTSGGKTGKGESACCGSDF